MPETRSMATVKQGEQVEGGEGVNPTTLETPRRLCEGRGRGGPNHAGDQAQTSPGMRQGNVVPPQPSSQSDLAQVSSMFQQFLTFQARREQEEQRRREEREQRLEEERREERQRLEEEKQRMEEARRQERDQFMQLLRKMDDRRDRELEQAERKENKIEGLKFPFFEEGKDKIDEYLEQFERVAEVQKWKRDTWSSRLLPFLRGTARTLFFALSKEESDDYDKLRDALLKRFNLTAEGYRQRFRNSKKDPGESFVQFVVRLGTYLTKWCCLAGKDEKKACDLRDLLLQEQLMETLTSDLAIRVREKLPEDVNAAARAADVIVEAKRACSSKRPPPTNHQGRPGLQPKTQREGQPNSGAPKVFEEVRALVTCCIDGFNICIFAYGQTGSGKTFTMEGPSTDPGINQRALQELFQETAERGQDWHYTIEVSVLEIYNETIKDLLSSDNGNKLDVKMKADGGGYHVPGLHTVAVTSLKDVNQVFAVGKKNRATATTNMNEHSSRSHCLLCVTVTGVNRTTNTRTFGRLNLVDLAGSERVSKSGADGARLREAQNINKSLACLGDVIHALRIKQNHIPFRNSKLTYLLQDSLGGDSKTLMIVQVAPVEKNVAESTCSLSFGQRVRNVELGAATRKIENVDELKSPPSPISIGTPPAKKMALSSPVTVSQRFTPGKSSSPVTSSSKATPRSARQGLLWK